MLRSLLLAAIATFSLAADWPQWRGPSNNGVSDEKDLPTKWSEKEGVAWKLDLPGEGCSTPAISGGKIFLTCLDGKQVFLMCISTAGKEEWRRELGKTVSAGRGDEGNAASASPSTDGKAVYTFTSNGTVAAFDFAGKELWRFNAQDRYGKFRIAFGLHSTPVLHDGKLYLQLIHDGGAWVICINARDGEESWKVKRVSDGTAENKHGYSSPFLWTNGKDAYLVTHGQDYAIAYELKKGEELWRVVGLNPRGMGYRGDLRFVASPVCTPELIVVPSAKNKGVVAIKPGARGEVASGSEHEVWRLPSGTPDVPSPLVHDGIVYLAGEGGSLTALDAKTGKSLYKKSPGKGRHRANPVLADGKLYVTGRDSGTVNVIKAGKEYELLASNKLPDVFAASPAISGGRIYLRGLKSLWAIGK